MSPSTLLPQRLGARAAGGAEEALPQRGPESLLPADAQLPVRRAGPEVVPVSPSALLPDSPRARAAGRTEDELPQQGPSSLLPDTSGERHWSASGPELVAVSPSSLLPDATGERSSRSGPEPLPQYGPSSLMPEARSERVAEPVGPEVVAVSPSELLPPVAPPLRMSRRRVVLVAGVFAVTVLLFLAVLTLSHRLGPDARELLQTANAQIAAGDYPGAIVNLREAARKAPTLDEVRVALGTALLHAGDAAAAEQELRRALDFGFPAQKLTVPLARSMLLQGKNDQLLREFTVAGTSSAESADLLAVIGLAHLAADRTFLAREHLTRALELEPESSDAMLGMARLALRDGTREQAMTLVEKVLARHPKNVEALVMRAELYRFGGNTERARAAYEGLLAVSPNNVDALIGLAEFDIREKRFEQAETRLALAATLYPRSVGAAHLHGLLQFRRGRLDDARKQVQRALKVQPSHMPSVLLAAAIEYADGKHPDAQRALLWVLHRNPYHLPARRMYGASLLQTGQPVRAIEILEPMLQLVPDNPALLSILGQAYAQVGNYAKAGDTLDKAERLAERRRRATGREHELGPALDQEATLLEETLNLDSGRQEHAIRRVAALYGRGDYGKAEQVLAEALAKAPNDARLLNLRAALAIARKDFAAAERDLQRALALDPDYVPAAANMAQIDLVERTPRAARRRVEAINQRHPRNVDALLALARLGERIEATPDEIERWLLDAIQVDAKLVQPRVALGRHYLRHGQPAKALEQFNAAKALRSDDVEVLDGLALAYAALGQSAQAQAALTSLAMLRPDSAAVLHRLALAQINAGQKVAAGLLLQKALELDPKLTAARLTLARLELASGKVGAALDVARKLQREMPAAPAGFVLEGDVYRYQGKTDAAHALYARAWTMGRDRDVLLKLQQALLALGRADEGQKLMRTWLGEHPDDYDVRKELGNALLLSGRPAEAMAEYEALSKVRPSDADVLNNLAWAGAQLKDPRALQFAERAYALSPNDPNILDTLGRLLAQRGETDRALELLQHALGVAGDRQDIRYQLAQLYLMKGERRRARQELERVVAAGKDFAEHAQAVALLDKLR